MDFSLRYRSVLTMCALDFAGHERIDGNSLTVAMTECCFIDNNNKTKSSSLR